MEKKRKHGGKRPGAGRPPKAEEARVIYDMDKYCAPAEFWGILYNLVRQGDRAAIKLWANYRFGMPAQAIDVSMTDKEVTINIEWDKNETFVHTATKAALKSAEGSGGGEEV